MNKKASPHLAKPLGRSAFHRDSRPWRRRALAGAVSGGANLALLAGLFWMQAAPSAREAEPAPSTTLISLKNLPEPPGPPEPERADPGALQAIELPQVPQVAAPVVTIARTVAPDNSDLLSEAQLAGASRVGDGGGAAGGRCDTARAVQQVLRRDPRVRAAVESADRLGKASMLWNGDWIRSGGQEGKGLAVVRQAIIWEVAFEPEACRNEPMRGMVLLSLADGRTRFAIGTGAWRWSDLLELRGARAVR
jgi:hypothetical protein